VSSQIGCTWQEDVADGKTSSRYADHVGIHYILCSKLRQFSYEEIEFFLPQLCHLIISVDNESMALEEFILDLCEESVNAALLVSPLHRSSLFIPIDKCRHSGSSRHTCTTSPQIRNLSHSKHVEEYITRSSILCLGVPTPPQMKRSRRMFSPSPSWPVLYWPV
jgi:hypothetical protein